MSRPLWLPRTVFFFGAVATPNTNLVLGSYTVPNGRYAIVEHIFLRVNLHGNAVNTTFVFADVVDNPVTFSFPLLTLGFVAAPAVHSTIAIATNVLVEAGWLVRLIATNTGAGAVTMGGNIQLKERQ